MRVGPLAVGFWVRLVFGLRIALPTFGDLGPSVAISAEISLASLLDAGVASALQEGDVSASWR